jgi:stage II sporulation protein M
VIPDYPRILWDGRRWLAAAALLFLLGIAAGYVVAVTHPSVALAQIEPAVAKLHEVGTRVTSSRSPVERAVLIYRNNLTAVCVMLAGGLLAGVVPALALLFNGAMLGALIGLGGTVSPLAVSPLLLALSILPHGIFELPAVWCGGAWGMRLGLGWLRYDEAGARRRALAQTAIEAAQVLLLAAALLLLAAFIEGNVTPALVRSVRM